MADEDDTDDDDDDGGGGGRKKVSGKKLVLFIMLPVLVLIGAGAGVYMSGLLDPLLGTGTEEEQVAEDAEPTEE